MTLVASIGTLLRRRR